MGAWKFERTFTFTPPNIRFWRNSCQVALLQATFQYPIQSLSLSRFLSPNKWYKGFFTLNLSLPLKNTLKEFRRSKISQLLIILFFKKSSMLGPLKLLLLEQRAVIASCHQTKSKPGDRSWSYPVWQLSSSIVECLKYSPLITALTKTESVLMSLLSKDYSFAWYLKEEQRTTFEVHNRTTSIIKSRFCSILGLAQTDDMIDPESITNSALLKMFYQVGYKGTLAAISMFRKPNLSPQWNGVFNLIFKAFPE